MFVSTPPETSASIGPEVKRAIARTSWEWYLRLTVEIQSFLSDVPLLTCWCWIITRSTPEEYKNSSFYMKLKQMWLTLSAARHKTSAACARIRFFSVQVFQSQKVTLPSESPVTTVPSLRTNTLQISVSSPFLGPITILSTTLPVDTIILRIFPSEEPQTKWVPSGCHASARIRASVLSKVRTYLGEIRLWLTLIFDQECLIFA
jgi:hypothetical protein